MRTRSAICTAAAVLLGGVAALAPVTVAQADATPSAASGKGSLVVVDSKVLGPLHQQERVQARDNGQSVLYKGQSYWFFDDTILQNPFDFLSSTGATTRDLDASDGIDLTASTVFDADDSSTPTNLVLPTAPEKSFAAAHTTADTDCTGSADEFCGVQFGWWPGGAVLDAPRHRVLVSYNKLCRGAPTGTLCESGFIGHQIGEGMLSVDLKTHKVTRLVAKNRIESIPSPEGADPTMFFSPDEGWGGSGEMIVGSTLYAYGYCNDTACGVAKVPVAQVQDLSAWRYYAGLDAKGKAVWSTSPADTVRNMDRGPAGGTISWDDAAHAYLHTYMPVLSNDGMFQTSPTPWGPWSTPQKMYTATETDVTYAAFGHPEYDQNHGLTKYFTYYDSGSGAQELVRVDFKYQKS
jgi:hypothetical protein